MKPLMILFILFLGTGCHSLKRILDGAESHPPQPIVYNNPHVIQGVTSIDYQIIEYVPIENRTITVKVKEPFAAQFRTLSQYEYKLHNTYVPALEFGTYVNSEGGLIIVPWPRRPTAPTGTEYIITSVLP